MSQKQIHFVTQSQTDLNDVISQANKLIGGFRLKKKKDRELKNSIDYLKPYKFTPELTEESQYFQVLKENYSASYVYTNDHYLLDFRYSLRKYATLLAKRIVIMLENEAESFPAFVNDLINLGLKVVKIKCKEEATGVLYRQAANILYDEAFESSEQCLKFLKEESIKTSSTVVEKLFISDSEKDKFVVIRRLFLEKQKIMLVYEKREINRMIKFQNNSSDLFIICEIDLSSDKKADIIEILKKGIKIDDCNYIFFGHSQSQLKDCSCYLFNGSEEEINNILENIGDFSSIKTCAKRAARIGLLFSSCQLLVDLEQNIKIIEINDIERNSMIFTDGCGLCSKDVAKFIWKHYDSTNDSNIPSVFQIRLNGYKGIIVVSPCLSSNTIAIRNSMTKFKWKFTENSKMLGVCKVSRPLRFSYINQQVIMLLSALGVKNESLLKIQEEYFNSLEVLKELSIGKSNDIGMAERWLLLHGEINKAKELMKGNSIVNIMQDCFKTILDKEMDRNMMENIYERDPKVKLRIPLFDSRILFGVCDSGFYKDDKSYTRNGKLKVNQCFLRITVRPGIVQTIRGKVVVSKNPCYYRGDIRILEAIDIPELRHLVDCLVLPTTGNVPVHHTMAGSDLDGDEYFVSWCQYLIPKKEEKPFSYPSSSVPNEPNITRTDLIKHFVNFNRSILGKIDSLYHYFANRNEEGVNSNECVELGTTIFSKAVDSAKSGESVNVSKFFKKRNSLEDKVINNHVWVKMKENIELKCDIWQKEISRHINNELNHLDEFVIECITSNAFISEYEKFQLIYCWCENNNYPIIEFLLKIDFSTFGPKEWSLIQSINDKLTIPEFLKIPRNILKNSIVSSNILPEKFLYDFFLNREELPYKIHYRFLTQNEFTFFPFIYDALLRYNHILIAMKMECESIIVLELIHPRKSHFVSNTEEQVGYCVNNYFLSAIKKQFFHFTASKIYNLYFDKKLLQIFRRKRQNTFIFIKNDDITDLEHISTKVSIDLTSFKRDIILNNEHPLINKQPIKAIEIYVQSLDRYCKSDLYVEPIEEEYNEKEINEKQGIVFTDEEKKQSKLILHQIFQMKFKEDNQTFNNKLEELVSFQALDEIYEIYIDKNLVKKDHMPYFAMIKVLIQNKILHYNSITMQMVLKDLLLNFNGCFKFLIGYIQDVVVEFPEFINILIQVFFYNNSQILDIPKTKESFLQLTLSQQVIFLKCLLLNRKYDIFLMLIKELPSQLHSQYFIELVISLCEESLTEETRNDIIKLLLMKYYKPISNESSNFICKYINCLVLEMYEEMATLLGKSKGITCNLKIVEMNNIDDVICQIDTLGGNEFILYDKIIIIPKTELKTVSNKLDKMKYLFAKGEIIQLNPFAQMKLHISKVHKCRLSTTTWCLFKIGNHITFNRMVEALLNIESSPFYNIFEKCFKSEIISDESSCNVMKEEKQSNLNVSQKSAIFNCFTKRLQLVTGPPGTGKTKTLCSLIKQFIETPNVGQILAIAETNAAVDNIMFQLKEMGVYEMLRLGSSSSGRNIIHPLLFNYTLEKVKLDAKHGHLKEKKEVKKALRNAKIICVTCAGCGLEEFKYTNPKILLADEGSQLTLPKILIPLTLCKELQQISVFGDPNQLPPTVLNQQAKEHLGISFFEFLEKNGLKSNLLNVQYRMHKGLCEFPNEKFYGGMLMNGPQELKAPKGISWPSENYPLLFVNVASKCERKGTSLMNKEEAISVADKLVELLEGGDIEKRNIGIITPYTAQVIEINKELQNRNANLQGIDIKTVDGFQGREKDVILFSMVKTTDKIEEMKFLTDTEGEKRMNVMLTRAKRGLIIVANEVSLSIKNTKWKEWLDMYKQKCKANLQKTTNTNKSKQVLKGRKKFN